jgi:hypothetical protein
MAKTILIRRAFASISKVKVENIDMFKNNVNFSSCMANGGVKIEIARENGVICKGVRP